MTIDELCSLSYATAEEKGFHPAPLPEPTTLEEALVQLRDLKRQLQVAYFFQRMMLVVTECVEAVEGRRKDQPTDRNVTGPGVKPEGIPSELADVFIRLGDVCKEFQVPITEAIREKMAFNKTRQFRHGKVA